MFFEVIGRGGQHAADDAAAHHHRPDGLHPHAVAHAPAGAGHRPDGRHKTSARSWSSKLKLVQTPHELPPARQLRDAAKAGNTAECERLLHGFPREVGELQRLGRGVRDFQSVRWQDNWDECAAPIFAAAQRSAHRGWLVLGARSFPLPCCAWFRRGSPGAAAGLLGMLVAVAVAWYVG